MDNSNFITRQQGKNNLLKINFVSQRDICNNLGISFDYSHFSNIYYFMNFQNLGLLGFLCKEDSFFLLVHFLSLQHN